MKIVDQDGNEIPVAYIDGYSFADTLLEGVLFEISVRGDQLVCDRNHPSFDAYMSKFVAEQRAKWQAEALQVALEGDQLVTINNKDAWIEE